MPENLKVRLKASCIHFVISFFVLSLVSVALFAFYYPGLLGVASGVLSVFGLLIVVDLILGPLITFVIFNKNKRWLKLDISIVISVQLMALVYGLWILFSVRPVFIVFNIDRFDVVYANEVSAQSLARVSNSAFAKIPIWGPEYVGARLPQDQVAAKEVVMNAISGGDDLSQLPEYYVSFESISKDIIQNVRSLEDLKKYNKSNLSEVDALRERYLSKIDNIGYIPLKAKISDLTVIVDRSTGSILELSSLHPMDNSYGVNSIDLNTILRKSSDAK